MNNEMISTAPVFDENGLNLIVGEISTTLDIELDESPYTRGNLSNLFAKPTSKITSMKWSEISLYDNDEDTHKPLSDSDFAIIGYNKGIIKINEYTYEKEKGFFTIGELFDVILDAEKKIRQNSEWFGGIDVHHIFFEGLWKQKNGTFKIGWGS